MKKLNVHEAKTHLSRHLARLARGETIILCKRNVPVAEIRPIGGGGGQQRKIGLCAGEFEVTDKFFAPLPDEIAEAFRGDKK